MAVMLTAVYSRIRRAWMTQVNLWRRVEFGFDVLGSRVGRKELCSSGLPTSPLDVNHFFGNIRLEGWIFTFKGVQ